MKKQRLDLIMTDRGMVESRSLAQRLVMAGQVRVDGQIVLKPSVRIGGEAKIVIEAGPRFVSRGGEKLETAMQAFGLTVISGWVCVDVGASTGGFTDCLLQHGANRIYAVDVGYGVLHWKLRQDERVVPMEKTNARYISGFEVKIDLVTIDASFISMKVFLPVIAAWFGNNGGIILGLIKPQFEAGRRDASRGDGVIRDPAIHRKVLVDLLDYAQKEGYGVRGLIRSPLMGPKGNTEFLVRLDFNKPSDLVIEDLVYSVLPGDNPSI